MKIAVIGAGIAGLSAAHFLNQDGHAVALFEAGDYLGGHTHTVDVTLDGRSAPVDTGFLVYNDRTYPNLLRLFDELGVGSVESNMSFSVRADREGVEWSGSSLATLLARPSNLVRPGFWRMLGDIVRFNREATAMVESGRFWSVTLEEYLDAEGFSADFRALYLLPMAGAIWSAPARAVLEFPLPTFVRFCHNHGLLALNDRPQWRTVRGGGREYVRRIASRLSDLRLSSPVHRVRRLRTHVEIDSARGSAERFDQVVVACHSDQALAVLADPSLNEKRLLASVRYQPNRVVLHTDSALMPRRRALWSAWNYLAASDPSGSRPVAVTYWINKLQPLPFATPVLVTLNPPVEPARAKVIAEFEYAHPMIDGPAVAAQQAMTYLQGARRTWYAGAWLGHGFHEDGIKSAIDVVNGIRGRVRTPDDVRIAA